MKTIRYALAVLACLAFVSPSMAQPVDLITLTNSLWSTEQNANLDGVAWNESDYNDSAWRTGLGAFSFNDDDNPFIAPYINSTNEDHRVAVDTNSVPRVLYYRIHFNYTGNPATAIFNFTNLVDDGVVAYLNGTRIYSLRVTDDPATYATVATGTNPSGGDAEAFEVVQFVGSELTSLNVGGDNVLAIALYQNSPTSSDSAFALALTVEEGAASAPIITSPTSDQNLSVVEGQSRALTVEASGSPNPTYQWEFSNDDGATFNTITNGGTSATYTIGFMDATTAGLYRCVVANAVDSVTSPVFNVALQTDVTPPMVLAACSQDGGLAVRVDFTEDIIAYDDSIRYFILNPPFYDTIRQTTNRTVNGSTLILGGVSDIVTGNPFPLEAGTDYELFIIYVDPDDPGQPPGTQATITDLFGNILPFNTPADPLFGSPATIVAINEAVSFQEGVNGYIGTLDTEIRGNNTTQDGSELTILNPDGADGGSPVNGLVRFENIFGNSVGQIAPGSVIITATLTLTTANGGQGSQQGVHRMLIPWVETDNWTTLGMADGVAGLQADDNEALATPSGTFTPTSDNPEMIDVTADVRAWANGEANYGWALLPQGTDGWDLNSSEATPESVRPLLVVCFAPVECTEAPTIDANGQPMDVTVDESENAAMSVIALCGETFQWQRSDDGGTTWNDVNGEVSSVLSFTPALPSDDAHYRVVVGNSIDSVISEAAKLTVIIDDIAPTLVSSDTDGDAGTVTLVFDEPLESGAAQNTANYVVNITAGGAGTLAVNSAVLDPNGTDVVLTLAAPSLDQRYSLTINNLTDLALNPNVIDPIVIDPLIFGYLIIDWTDLTWSYTTNGVTDAPVPGWEAPGFDDSGWDTGMALFGLETSGGVTALFPPGGIQTDWPLGEGENFITAFYLRTTANIAFAPAPDVSFVFRHLIDDGAVFYVGGAEAARVRMSAAAPVQYTDIADSAADYSIEEAVSSVPFVMGDNALAVEVHQGSATGSSDILFGTQILAYGGFLGEPSISITQDATTVTVSWDAPVPLLSAPTPAGPWTEVVGATSPYVLTKPLADDMLYFGLGAP